MSGHVRTVFRHLILFSLYVTTGVIGLKYAILPSGASAIWPPAGIAIAFTLWYGRGMAFTAGAGVIPLVAFRMILLGKPVTTSILVAGAWMGLGNTVSYLIACEIMRHGFRREPSEMFHSTRGLVFFIVGALVGSCVAALNGCLALGATTGLGCTGFLFTAWSVGDYASMLIITHFLIGLRCRFCKSTFIHSTRHPERILFYTLMLWCGVAYATMHISIYTADFLLLAMWFFVLWPSLRLTSVESAFTVVVFTAATIIGTSHGIGIFSLFREPRVGEVFMQTYIGSMAIVSLFCCAEAQRVEELDIQKKLLLDQSKWYIKKAVKKLEDDNGV